MLNPRSSTGAARRRTCLATLLGALLLPLAAACGPDYQPEELESATEEIRSVYFDRYWPAGVRLGETWTERAPDTHELRAWYVHHLARNQQQEDAIAEADAMVEEAPDSPWSHFALAGALNDSEDRGEEALEASELGLRTAPADARSDFLWIRAEVLREQEGQEAAIAFVDSLPESERTPHLLVRKAVALHFLANERREENPAEADSLDRRAFQVFEGVRERDPDHVEAHFLAGSYHYTTKDLDRALPLLQRSAELTPAPRVHQYYWRAIRSQPDLSAEEKNSQIEADIASLLERQEEPGPAVLRTVGSAYDEMGREEEAERYEDRVLEEYPGSVSAEWVLVYRYRDMRREISELAQQGEEPDSALERRYREALVSFIQRTPHQRETLLGDACRNYFYILTEMEEPDVSDERFREIVRCMADHEGINTHTVFGRGSMELAEHTEYYREAEELAREGMEKAKEEIDRRREMGAFDSEGDYQRNLDWYTGIMVDALGWIYFQEGRIEEAKSELLRAHEMDPDNRTNLFHLGRLYEEQDSLDRAEDYYMDGAMVQGMGENPSDAALKALYEERNGGLEGWEDYRENLAEIDAQRRKTEVLAERLDDPEPMTDFRLATLSGDTLSANRVDGKVVVINFWGVWCGPCVAEMPDIQEFYEQIRDDPDVVLLTINNDTDPNTVREWMDERDYDFPVLLDDGYVMEVGVQAFPTTWFVAPDGEIEFSKRGWSEELVQEFTWRVEAIQQASD